MAKRLGKLERQQQRLAARWRASKVNDNLKVSLHEVKRYSDVASPFDTATLQSKGARGGGSPYGRNERFIPKQPRR